MIALTHSQLFASLLGFLFSGNFFLAYLKEKKNLPQLFFSIYLFFFSVILIEQWEFLTQPQRSLWICDSYGALVASFYGYMMTSLRPSKPLSHLYLYLFIPAALEVLLHAMRILDFVVLNTYWIDGSLYSWSLEIVEYSAFVIGIVLWTDMLLPFAEKKKKFLAIVDKRKRNWLISFVICQLVLMGFWGMVLLENTFQLSWVDLIIFIMMPALMIGFASDFIQHPWMFRSREAGDRVQNLRRDRVQANPASSSKAEELQKRILDKHLHRNPDMNLGLISKEVSLPKVTVSELINHHFGKSFRVYVNDLRVEEAKEMLHDPAYAHLSILGIALEVGFKSESTFYTSFKRNTGTTPLAFRKHKFS
ncbi:MAG: helix-turn-helix domain-containing protein [Bacteroidota bacterium]